jgi:hypothetical protein
VAIKLLGWEGRLDRVAEEVDRFKLLQAQPVVHRVERFGDHGCEYMTGGRASCSGRRDETARPG